MADRVRFRKIERMPGGGYGAVWRAANLETGDEVVMKFPLDTLDMSPGSEDRRRFEREARYQSMLKHPGIMPIIAMNLRREKPFFAMPLAEGSLQDQLEYGPIHEEESIGIITDVLYALEYAHQQGVLHRDLKPANLLFLDGRWVISDFGLCRLVTSESTTITRANSAVGSIAYMAPEQFDNAHDVAETAGIYSIGQILYHCLTGEVPFPRARMSRLDVKFRYVISRCIAEEPDERYQSVAELRRELELITAPQAELASPTAQANELKAKALDGDTKAVDALLGLLLDSADDEIFIKEFTPSLPQELLAQMAADYPLEFERMVRTYDEYCEGGHPFAYTDDIADFFARVLVAAEHNKTVRYLSLERIMIVGTTHNRFYVGEVFSREVSRLTAPEEISYVVEMLRNNPACAIFMASYLRRYSLHRSILRALD
ncbi:serine/threonine-protein kinase [Streptomyces barringtoniae]|uniref:serine/threonine-protein kinase n=1 Tax=Streptomyces barringtoniae TaxID=2892029 RepID=UPI001E64ED3F|nr:serine/threonine-protein kinase [Streptomyces barringtoniae]MCC5479058.1 serine/threonine protein kinase [Streptomyces barringtoniae]